MDAKEVAPDQPVSGRVEHRPDPHLAENGTPARNAHAGHRIDLVEVHHVGKRLILGPEDRWCVRDALDRGAEARCAAMQRDLWNRRADGEQHHPGSALAELRIEPQGAVEKVDRENRPEAVPGNQDFVEIMVQFELAEDAGGSVEASSERWVLAANVMAGEDPVVEEVIKKELFP